MRRLKADILIISLLLGIAVILWIFAADKGKYGTGKIYVRQDGNLIGTYELDEDNTISIPYGALEYNLLVIKEGKAIVTDADCGDKLCVRQNGINKNGESIICLPHKLIIQVEAGEESELDAVTY